MKKKQILKLTAILLTVLQLAALLSGCIFVPGFGEAEAPLPTIAEGIVETGESSIDPLFWEVTSEQYSGKVYLLGSMHACTADTYPLPAHIMEAYSGSEAVAVECDILEFENDMAQQVSAMQYIMYSDGTKIADHLSEESYNSAVARLKELGIYSTQFDRYKPMMWSSLIEGEIVEKAGLSYDYGVDSYLLAKAKIDGKTVLQIESVEYQYSMMGGFSDGLQELLLQDYLPENAVEEQTAVIKELFNGWKTGDPAAMSNKIDEETLAGMTEEERQYVDEYFTQMLDVRNLRMADAAESYVKRGMTVFLVVGAAHMVDENGIVNTLRERGYTVTEQGGRY
ncbi:MAG: TraB/GumN family protein [Oscillospiraceae bacterium]|nr:TraB/GumN family protein [Oscillospiraceae bacterium]MBQ9939489.1 TraB/GumN family protein [Oscillospiraceae bacterium]